MRRRASLPRTNPLHGREVILLLAGLLLVASLLSVCLPPALAQEATPDASAAPAEATTTPAGPTPTATATSTPTATPSPTPTFTALQARLALAQAYLRGGDYARAAEIFAAVALEDRGNAEALAGLDAALQGQAAATATAVAPPPTPEPTAAPAGPGYGAALAGKAGAALALAVAALVLATVLYLAARGLRWLLSALREVWFTRVRRPPVRPGIIVGEFHGAPGEEGSQGSRVVAQALTEQLAAWNEAAAPGQENPILLDRLDTPGLAWLGALWHGITLPRRAYRVRGVLYGRHPGPYRLAADRIDLRSNRVDASRAFESSADAPAQAFRELGMAAAFWARDPVGMEGTPGLLEMPARAPGISGAARAEVGRTPIQIAAEALRLMGLVRAQVKAENVDYTTAPRALDEAQALIEQLPAAAALRHDLQTALDDLWRRVQPGRAR